jgi:hypothetical protein
MTHRNCALRTSPPGGGVQDLPHSESLTPMDTTTDIDLRSWRAGCGEGAKGASGMS